MDPRNYESGAVGTPPSAPTSPSNGYPTDGDPTVGTPATRPGAHWYHKIGEELRSIIVAAGLTPSDAVLTQLKSALDALYAPSGDVGYINLIVNGSFAINQRGYVSGTATTAAHQPTLDRWRVVVSGQNLSFTPSGAGNVITAPAGGVEQMIEGASIQGGTYTVAWTGTATCKINGAAVQNGSQVTLPANTDATLTFFSGTAGAVRLVPGTSAGNFFMRSFADELALCQREYWVLGHAVTYRGYSGSAGSQAFMNLQFPVQMRINPTITANFTGGVNNASQTVSGQAADGFLLQVTSIAAGDLTVTYSAGNSAATGW